MEATVSKTTPCLWFDGQAQEAAEFYTTIFPNSQIERIQRAPSGYPSGRHGGVLTVDFTIDGQPFVALNGGPDFTFNESISFMIDCANQEEVDRYWDALIEGGGEHGQCGWLKDRFGVSWQVVPARLNELLAGSNPDAVKRTFDAMLEMDKLDIARLEEAYVNPERVTAGAR